MLRPLALALTVLFQPLVMPTLVFGTLLFAVPQATTLPQEFKSRLFYVIVLSTWLLPMALMLGLRWGGWIKSLHFEELAERRMPFVLVTLVYVLTTAFFYQKTELDPILWQGMAVMTGTVVLLTGITLVWKMSAHLTGLGGLLGVVGVLSTLFPAFTSVYLLLGALLLTGGVASARLYLHAHRPVEIYAGLAMGFVCCWLGFLWIYS